MLVNQYQQITHALEGDEELLVFYYSDLSKRNNLILFFDKIKDLEPKTIKNIILSIKIVEDEEDKYRRRSVI